MSPLELLIRLSIRSADLPRKPVEAMKDRFGEEIHHYRIAAGRHASMTPYVAPLSIPGTIPNFLALLLGGDRLRCVHLLGGDRHCQTNSNSSNTIGNSQESNREPLPRNNFSLPARPTPTLRGRSDARSPVDRLYVETYP